MPKSVYERVQAHRLRVLADGGDRVDMLLPAHTSRALSELALARGKSRGAVIIELIERARLQPHHG